jgi:uncharacterized DUF497 family protein
MSYTFEWDENKSQRCFVERGFDFAYAARAFFDPDRKIKPDQRYQYGEDRFTLSGYIEARLYVIAYTVREDVIRIISARKANAREIKHHEHRQNAS